MVVVGPIKQAIALVPHIAAEDVVVYVTGGEVVATPATSTGEQYVIAMTPSGVVMLSQVHSHSLAGGTAEYAREVDSYLRGRK